MKDILYIAIFALVILWLTGCSAKYDGFNPATSAFRWVITNGKN
jgi:hypothetical protein